ncbi:MAG TPA: M50 family metallopeptidase, partial [Acidimicrobiales bacterium]|nr:M50 family metallopeptidase [Acidimicrobiales bacterium]
SGMKVTEYFVGFGPRLWSIRRGETEYGVKAIPAGGYVKIIGMSNLEEVDPADEPRTYRQQPFHNRLMVALAGSFVHFLLAFILLWGLLTFVGVPDSNIVTIQGLAPIHHVDPARTAGIRPGDVVVSAEGKPVHSAEELTEVIKDHPGQPVTLGIERNGTKLLITVVPAVEEEPVSTGSSKTSEQGRIGVLIAPGTSTTNPIHAVGSATVDFGRVVSSSLAGLGHTFSPHGLSSFFGQLDNPQKARAAAQTGNRPESILGAVRTATQGVQAGATDFIEVLIALNIIFGIINLFPMLPLDGGHVAVAVYERIRSRKGRMYHADVAKLTPVAYAFVGFLLIFVVSAVYLDIAHPVANPFR